MGKIRIPKYVADAIEGVWNEYIKYKEGDKDNDLDKRHLLLNDWSYIYAEHYKHWASLKDYAEDRPITYMIALVEGYEIELSLEERVKEHYKGVTESYYKMKSQNNKELMMYYEGQRKGIESTLELLDRPIVGVNTREYEEEELHECNK